MEQEAAYIEALHDATTYRVTDDRLDLVDAKGRTRLIFRQATQVARRDPGPIEGAPLLTNEEVDEAARFLEDTPVGELEARVEEANGMVVARVLMRKAQR